MNPNPFIFKPSESTLPVRQQDQILNIANDGSMNVTFHTTTKTTFWMKVLPDFPDLALKALNIFYNHFVQPMSLFID